jgi:tetrahydromethanopterin S-methyltransferase subunit F
MEEKIAERIATLEANNANIFHQLDDIKTDVKDIRRLTVAVEKIAVQTESTARKVDNIDIRLDNVEQRPAADFAHYKRVIIGSICTGVIGIIIGAVFALIIKK